MQRATRYVLIWLAALVAAGGSGSLFAEEGTRLDEQLLKARNIGTDGASLLSFFRKRSLTQAEEQHLQACIRQLGSEAFKARTQASNEIAVFGPPALPFLKRALENMNLEVSRRAQELIKQIQRQGDADPALTTAAVHLLAVRRPAGAVEALLTFLPFNEDEWVEEEVLDVLRSMGFRQGRAEPSVPAFLGSPVPARRAAAAFIVGRSSDPEERSGARQRLTDAVPEVRLRAAQGLIAGGDPSAVPALIALLADGPILLTYKAEEILFQIAGDQAPSATAGDASAAARQKHRDAWAAWWRDRSPTLNLSRLTEGPRHLGLTVVAEMDSNKVWEFGPDGKARWKLERLLGPMDAQVLPNGRVLIAEYQGQRITERDLQGNIHWTKRVNGSPIACQRLANGNTFVATHNSLFEVTPDGKEVNQRSPGSGLFVFGAQKLSSGHIACIANPGILLELDNAGKTVRTIRLGNNQGGWCGVEVLPGGRFLVALLNASKVLEIDAAGKTLWQCSVPGASHAIRLPNGHTLVASMTNRRVVEVDREGKTIKEMTTDGRPWRVHRR
jgi:hypothetical protein